MSLLSGLRVFARTVAVHAGKCCTTQAQTCARHGAAMTECFRVWGGRVSCEKMRHSANTTTEHKHMQTCARQGATTTECFTLWGGSVVLWAPGQARQGPHRSIGRHTLRPPGRPTLAPGMCPWWPLGRQRRSGADMEWNASERERGARNAPQELGQHLCGQGLSRSAVQVASRALLERIKGNVTLTGGVSGRGGSR